jgi:hypothetical protein
MSLGDRRLLWLQVQTRPGLTFFELVRGTSTIAVLDVRLVASPRDVEFVRQRNTGADTNRCLLETTHANGTCYSCPLSEMDCARE